MWNPTKIEATLIDPNVSIAKVIGYSAKVIHAVMAKAYENAGLELQMDTYILMKIVQSHEGVIQQDLSEMLRKDKSALLRMINALQDKKWVARIPDKEDKRRNYVVLTQLGLQVFEEAAIIEEHITKELVSGVEKEEIDRLKNILNKVRVNGYQWIENR